MARAVASSCSSRGDWPPAPLPSGWRSCSGPRSASVVGYQTRDERRIGRDTRIEVVTEGVLTRRLQHDPELPGVGLVIFDEVHERNVPTDVGLAFALDAREHGAARPAHAGDVGDTRRRQARRRCSAMRRPIESVGRSYPVDVRWLPMMKGTRVEQATGDAVLRALERGARRRAGLPARASARSAASSSSWPIVSGPTSTCACSPARCRSPSRTWRCCRRPTGRRRVVLSTDIAESSLTVSGVRIVVDAGLARVPRLRPRHRDDPADDGQHQPGVGRPARRSGRAHRAGRRLPAVEQARARHPPGPPRGRDHPGRPGRCRPRAGRVGNADRASCVHRSAAAAGAAAGARAAATPRRARRATADRPRPGRAMLALPLHPRLARMVSPRRADERRSRA